MTIAKLVEHLQAAAEKFGADCEVKVRQGDAELNFKLYAIMVFDDASETGVGTELVIEVDQ